LCDLRHIYQMIAKSECIPVGAKVVVTTNPMDFEQEDTMEKILAFAGIFSLVYTIALLRVSFSA